jgi:hypothetical protein
MAGCGDPALQFFGFGAMWKSRSTVFPHRNRILRSNSNNGNKRGKMSVDWPFAGPIFKFRNIGKKDFEKKFTSPLT